MRINFQFQNKLKFFRPDFSVVERFFWSIAEFDKLETKEEENKEKQRIENAKTMKNKDTIKERKREYYLKTKDERKEYYIKNREKVREIQKEYSLKNKEKLKELSLEYRLKNKEKIKETRASENNEKKVEYNKEYFLKNKEKIRERKKEYCIKNKDKLKKMYRDYKIKKSKEKNEHYIRKTNFSYKDHESTRNYFDFMSKLFNINDLSDWYRISRKQLTLNGGGAILLKFGTLGNALQYAYPEFPWEPSKFSFRGKKSAQRWLYVKMKQLLPETTIIEEFYHPDLIWDNNLKNKHIQFDIWISEYNLALEYQGEHHYFDLPSAFGPGSTPKLFYERDQFKKQLCLQEGISLVYIPYWWDGKIDSLSATLHQNLPHVFPKTDSDPIPATPPNFFEKKKQKIFNVKSHIMQGLDWNNEDPTGWYMSEKLDGVRAYWDGTQFWSKKGKIINVPDSFKEGLPNFHLDGEIWGGYENCDRTNTIIKMFCGEKRNYIDMKKFKFFFCVFDAPDHEGFYPERHSFIQNYFKERNGEISSFLSLIPIQKCSDRTHLQAYLKEIVHKGGEGIMIYHPSSYYEHGRTRNLLKVKLYLESDVKFQKCNVNSYSFICEQENGKLCVLKCSSSDYLNPPSVGAVIKARHLGFFRSGKLKFPYLISQKEDEQLLRLNEMKKAEKNKE